MMSRQSLLETLREVTRSYQVFSNPLLMSLHVHCHLFNMLPVFCRLAQFKEAYITTSLIESTKLDQRNPSSYKGISADSVFNES